ncbi:MAG: tyrosine--tRNA ligase [Candidatus Yanofskybacteria bacterium RIFCSPLOWO2_01_FULL_41_34]|uniref:Tyrosine--tRNA ligase n=1 Tax=Candidatus Yanofskybacteria bacterium RIFCSPHIGHO2_01_FULL_41_26 TaxID=1802661 RepID=A0A1F8EBZ1_9BACT|nr:MAG: tyrosine--tRNA ligase [Candidatus Yanofskybacteria bacterium RIFCSPHIGHO2_01_FULL_41_26]OGN21653.1 MAG: tyrosine--tRNA ligase [Candidatus Yanofskybacteria bacterium RIFCSPLOWO2_01_FULL_41_34]
MFGNKINTKEDNIRDFFSRYIENVFPSQEKAMELLKSGRRLSFYLGIDPTGPDIHLGHSTNFFVLKKLIEMGHNVTLLIGDFTAQIGDPTGKSKTRNSLTVEEVKQNMKTYLEQAIKILPKGKFKVRYNSEWHRNMTFQRVIELASNFTVQQMIERDMFQNRLKNGEPIYLQEFLYPLVQGYDSVAMEVDGEIGGTDQTFNMLAGRTLSKKILNKEKFVITTRLLEDPVTKKKIMNKSEGIYISMNENSKDLYGKVMAVPDSGIIALYELATEVPLVKVRDAEKRMQIDNPKLVKEEVARALVEMYHGIGASKLAEEEFDKVFSKGELPEQVEEAPGKGMKLVDFLTEHALATSSSEAKRLLDQGAVSVNEEVVKAWGHLLKKEDVIRVGSRKFLKVF